jgi:hypothetical protein
MGLISLLPLFAYIGWLIQYLVIIGKNSSATMSTILSQNYDGALLFFILCFGLTAAVLVYFVVHVARLATMPSGSKAIWILFMTFAAPIAFPVFWFIEVRREPERLPMHPDIA